MLRDGSWVERRGSDGGGGGGLRMAKGERKTLVRSGNRILCPWLHLVVSVFGASPGIGWGVVNCD